MSVDSLIVIRNASYNDVKTALEQWIDTLFDDVLNNDLVFKLYKDKANQIILQIDERVINKDFFYLVIFLHNHKKLKNRAEIKAFTTGKEKNILENEKLLVFVLSDNWLNGVSVATESGGNFRLEFDAYGKITKIDNVRHYESLDNLVLENPEILSASDFFLQKQKQAEQKIPVRYTIFFAIILLVVLYLNLIVKKNDFVMYKDVVSWFGLGIGIWFLTDYKMLRVSKFYLISLCIAIFYLGFGSYTTHATSFGILYPLVLLLFQKPLRKGYMLFVGLDPKVNRYEGTVFDNIYAVILMLIPLALSFWIEHLIK